MLCSLFPLGGILTQNPNGSAQGCYAPASEISSETTTLGAYIQWLFVLPNPHPEEEFTFRTTFSWAYGTKAQRTVGAMNENTALHFFSAEYGALNNLHATARTGLNSTSNSIYEGTNPIGKDWLSITYAADSNIATAFWEDTQKRRITGARVEHAFVVGEKESRISFFPRGVRPCKQYCILWGNPQKPYVIYPLRSVAYVVDGKQGAWNTYNNELFTE